MVDLTKTGGNKVKKIFKVLSFVQRIKVTSDFGNLWINCFEYILEVFLVLKQQNNSRLVDYKKLLKTRAFTVVSL